MTAIIYAGGEFETISTTSANVGNIKYPNVAQIELPTVSTTSISSISGGRVADGIGIGYDSWTNGLIVADNDPINDSSRLLVFYEDVLTDTLVIPSGQVRCVKFITQNSTAAYYVVGGTFASLDDGATDYIFEVELDHGNITQTGITEFTLNGPVTSLEVDGEYITAIGDFTEIIDHATASTLTDHPYVIRYNHNGHILYPYDNPPFTVGAIAKYAGPSTIMSMGEVPTLMMALTEDGTSECNIYVIGFYGDILDTLPVSGNIINSIISISTDPEYPSPHIVYVGGMSPLGFNVTKYDITTSGILSVDPVFFSNNLSGVVHTLAITPHVYDYDSGQWIMSDMKLFVGGDFTVDTP